MTAGDRIKELRTAAGLSQRELAQRVDLSYAYLSRVESGDRNPSRRALDKIAVELDVNGIFLEDGAGESFCPHCGTPVTVSPDGLTEPII